MFHDFFFRVPISPATRWAFPLTSGVLVWNLSTEQARVAIWLNPTLTTPEMTHLDIMALNRPNTNLNLLSHRHLRSQLQPVQYSSAWNCTPGNRLFLALSLSLSYFAGPLF